MILTYDQVLLKAPVFVRSEKLNNEGSFQY